jgi:hypothetical protein
MYVSTDNLIEQHLQDSHGAVQRATASAKFMKQGLSGDTNGPSGMSEYFIATNFT